MFIILLISTIAVAVLAVYSAMRFKASEISININNVAFLKFLKGDSGFISFIFSSILAVGVVYSILLCCCCKKFLCTIAVVFYLYFVYYQMVVLTSIIVIYGFFNTLILFLFLFLFFVLEFVVFIFLLLELCLKTSCNAYFKTCFNSNLSLVLLLSVALLILTLAFCLMLTLLKSFIILLVFWKKHFKWLSWLKIFVAQIVAIVLKNLNECTRIYTNIQIF